MANTVKLKRSATPSAAPTTSQLDLGEVAINTYDGKMYIKKDNGTASIVEIGGGGGASALDDLTDVTISSPASGQVLSYNGSGWVNAASAGGGSVYYKDPVRVATTANGTLSTAFQNGSVIDGVTLATGDRILLKNQSTASENGIYVVNASGAPTRATDMDANAEVQRGCAVYVQFGTVNGGSNFQVISSNATPIVVGTSTMVWGPAQGIAVYGLNAWTAPTASGTNSIAIGNSASAGGTSAVSIGRACTSTGNYSIAIGDGNNWGSGTNSVAIGQSSAVNGISNTTSIGGLNSVSNNCTAVGYAASCFSDSFFTAYAVALGHSTQTDSNAIAIGSGTWANVKNSAAIGYNARAPFTGAMGISFGYFANTNDAVLAIAQMWATTTNTTATELGALATNSQSAGSTAPTSRIVLTNDSTYLFDCDIVARNTTTDTESKVWNVKFGIRRGTSAANTALIGTPTYTVYGEDTGTSAWAVTVTADTTNGRPNISVTGEASKTIRWVANIRMTKVSG